jgi:cation diffusion facilitator family transporter
MSLSHKERSAAIGIRSSLIGVAANITLAAIKGIAGIIGNSYALIADAVESASDVASSLIVLGGIKIAARPADEDHPYGHGKAEPLAAMIVAGALLTAALGIAIQSVREIVTPHHTPAPFTLVVLLLVVLVKEGMFRYVIRKGRETHSTAVTTDAWHHRSDAITSAAAFIGIAVAVFAGPGYESADDFAALAASCIIGYNGFRFLRHATREVMDSAPPAVVGLDKCYVRKMGLEYYVDLHVVVDGEITVRRGHDLAHEVKDAIRRANAKIADVLVHIEPPEEMEKQA